MASVCPKFEQLSNLGEKQMKSVALVYQSWINFALYLQENIFLPMRIGTLLKKYAKILFQ